MNLSPKKLLQASLVLITLSLSGIANAGTFFIGGTPGGYISPYPYYPYPNYYYPPVYATPPVVVNNGNPVLVIPRYGSNDAHYMFDNIYGPGASAAGRLNHVTSNPQPFIQIIR